MAETTGAGMKTFTEKDIEQYEGKYPYIMVNYSENLIYDPLEWQKKGLMQTATGYGRKLTSTYKIKIENRFYRIYTCIFSNVGTSFVVRKGKEIIIT